MSEGKLPFSRPKPKKNGKVLFLPSFQFRGKQMSPAHNFERTSIQNPHVYNVSLPHAHRQIRRGALLPVTCSIMPSYSASDTTIQLSVADLGRATTPNPRTQQSLSASATIRDISQGFTRGSRDGTLTETSLETEQGHHLRFLGKQGTMPFLMVHAGQNFFDLSSKERRNRRPARMPLADQAEGKSALNAADVDKEKTGIGTSRDGKIPHNRYYILAIESTHQ